jgi:hypothetical protein
VLAVVAVVVLTEPVVVVLVRLTYLPLSLSAGVHILLLLARWALVVLTERVRYLALTVERVHFLVVVPQP